MLGVKLINMLNKCPLCESSETRLKWRGKGQLNNHDSRISYACANNVKFKPDLYQCIPCKHIYSDRTKWPSALDNDYAEVVDLDYLELEHVKTKTFKRAAAVANRFFFEPGKMIEIGAYTGVFLEIMRDKGWECIGIEPSRWAVDICKSKNLDIRSGTFEIISSEVNLEPANLVVSWDVLEHVVSPRDFLFNVEKVVKPGGIFILSTLDRTNFFARLTGKNWPWIVNMHLHYFDQAIIKDLADKFGFELLSTKAHVHYATINYILKKVFGGRKITNLLSYFSFLDKFSLPIGFGDVRYYVFKKR